MENQKNGEKIHGEASKEQTDYRALYERAMAECEVLRTRVGILGGEFEDFAQTVETTPETMSRTGVYRIPILRKLCKFIVCWKTNGFAYTLRRVKEKLFDHPKAARAPLYTDEELEAQRTAVFPKKIKISILVPLYNTPECFLDEMISSVTSQTYSDWELCLADGSDDAHASVGEYVKKLAESEPRILYRKLTENLGISGNTNACIDMASGDYIALFDHDDVLHPAALYEIMCAICEQDADFVYTDELTFESPNQKKIASVHFKPDFAPDNLRANNYICHFSVFRRTLLDRAGRFRKECDGSQDHDMILRLTDAAERVVHIPKILYLWRSHPQSVAMDIDSKGYAIAAGRRAVRDSILRGGGDAVVESSRAFPAIYRIRYALESTPKVSILITGHKTVKSLRRCIASIMANTAYPFFEIVIVDHGTRDDAMQAYYDRIAEYPIFRFCSADGATNFAGLANLAVQHATGEYCLFLDANATVINEGWLEELLSYALREDVAAVGAKLYYSDDTISHAGIVIGVGRDRLIDYAFQNVPRSAIGYMGRLFYSQNVSAVSSACMMIKRSVYLESGGFDEAFEEKYFDVDLCLRLRRAGYLLVWTPYAELYDYNAKRRSTDDVTQKSAQRDADAVLLSTRWKETLAAGDPYYNPNFSWDRADFRSR